MKNLSISNKKYFWIFLFFINFTALYCPDVTYSTGTTLTSDLRLSLTPSQRAIFNATLTLDGAGFFYQFPITATDQVLVVNNSFTATLQNILLRDFCIGHLSLGSGSSILFGDNTYFSMTKDFTIASGSPALNFNGNAEINGNGATLTIDKSQGITITGSSKTLTLKNMRLITSTTDAIRCLTSTCKVIFQNVDWVIKNNFAFPTGACDISGTVRINADLGATANPVTFLNWEWTSAGIMNVTNSAELVLGYGVNFKYNANPTGAGSFNATKRRFLLNQFGSKLTFNGASFESTATGLALDQGIINIYDEVILKPSTSTGAEFEIAKNVQINISGNGNVVLQGPIKYAEYLPMKVGDEISLKHSNYGTYMYQSNSDCILYTSLETVNGYSRYYVHSGAANSRFGNAGQYVLSGDLIRLESHRTSGSNIVMLNMSLTSALVSTPAPPYYHSAITGTNSSGGGFRATFRIHKLGGTVGDPIYLGDKVYIYHYPADLSSNLGYYYFGSSNVVYQTVFFESYFYKFTTNAQPTNLASNFTWTVNEIFPAAYAGASGVTDPFSSLDYSTFTPFWPSASSTQF